MPSGTPPNEPEETPRSSDHGTDGAAGSAPEASSGGPAGDDEVPVHPDDRLWRHPSELARLRATERAAAPPSAPTPTSARQGATNTWVSRIPTSVVIAAGVVAVITSVAGLAALAYAGTQADGEPPPSLDGETAAGSPTAIVAGSRRATGVIVDTEGVVLVAIDDPPKQATLLSGDRRAAVTLRSTDRQLALAAYQVDEDAGQGAGGAPTLAETARSRGSVDWALPSGSSDLADLDLDWVPSDWGPLLMGKVGDADLPAGTPLTERGRLLGMTTTTRDGQLLMVPWPVLRSLGAKLRERPLPMGGLPATLSDQGGHPMVAKAWGESDLRPKDRLVAVDGHPVSNADEAEAVAAFHPEGDTAKVACKRSGRNVTVDVTLE